MARPEVALTALAVVLGFVTWLALTRRQFPVQGLGPPGVTLLVVANLVTLMALLVLIARRVAVLLASRRARVAGAQLHVRLVGLFAGLVAVPTLLVVVFASLLFQFGVQFWFSDRARTVLENADRVAQAYVEENKARILDDTIAMARDLAGYAQEFGAGSTSFADGLAFQVEARNLSEAAVLAADAEGWVLIADVGLDERPLGERLAGLEGQLPPGLPRVLASAGDRVEAVVRLPSDEPLYAYVSRRVEPRVLEQVRRTEDALSDYRALTERSEALQWRFNLVLIVVALLVVAAAIWLALWLANRMVTPIGRLAEAARRVGAGEFDVRVRGAHAQDELGTLARAFNRMTRQIQLQQGALVQANHQSEARRRLIEAVLSGVSAGVLSVGHDGVVRLANRSAQSLLGLPADALTGRPLVDAVPELAGMLETARAEGQAAGEVVRASPEGTPQTLAVRLTAEPGDEVRSWILTFDDITDQLANQRRAAWADVARRIAHEIKNPLTPIMLSAERLERRFAPRLEGRDAQVFSDLTETIVRQVLDLRRMVDEFSAFARMPAAVFRRESLADIARQAVLMAEVAQPAIPIALEIGPDLPRIRCDRRQIGQALTNLVKNAQEAQLGEDGMPAGASAGIRVEARLDSGGVCILIEDEGRGLPAELRHRLGEPYVTTRARGTGLGLAIVKRIVEDHGGRFELEDRAAGGARAVLLLPVDGPAAAGETPADEQAGGAGVALPAPLVRDRGEAADAAMAPALREN